MMPRRDENLELLADVGCFRSLFGRTEPQDRILYAICQAYNHRTPRRRIAAELGVSTYKVEKTLQRVSAKLAYHLKLNACMAQVLDLIAESSRSPQQTAEQEFSPSAFAIGYTTRTTFPTYLRLREDLQGRFVTRTPTADNAYQITPVASLRGSQGILFMCPRCYAKTGDPEQTHPILCWFKRKVPKEITPRTGRWKPIGTNLENLTLDKPVVLHEPCWWSGRVENGIVTR
jgi:hypothetical protein